MTLQHIQNITISNWRCWKGEIQLDNIEKGFVIFNGPNAIGKSAVWEAIVAGLLDKQRGTHTDRLRPIGSSGLIPMVEIEFSANNNLYRIRKRFSRQLASSEATLYHQTGSSWKQIEEMDEAYKLCREIVAGAEAGEVSRGGFDNAVKDNLMQVLIPTQGGLVELVKAPSTVASLGVDKAIAESATQLGRILTKITNSISMWNKTRTNLIKSDLKDHLDRLTEIEEEINLLEDDSNRIEKYVNTLRTISEDLEDMQDTNSRIKEAGELRNQAEEHRKKREKAKEIADTTKEEAGKAEKLLKERKDLVTNLEKLTDKFEKAENDRKEKEKKLKSARKSLKELLKKRDDKKNEINTLRSWLDFETRGVQIEELNLSLDKVKTRLDTVDDVQKKLDGLKKEKAKLLLPDKKGWLEWDKLDEQLKEAKGKKEAESWVISGSLPKDFTIKVDGKEADYNKVSGLASTKIEITSPDKKHCFTAESSKSESENYDECLESVTKFLKKFDVKDIYELRDRHSRSTVLDTKISGAGSQISTALGGDTRDKLMQEIGRLNGELKKLKSLKSPDVEKPEGKPEEWEIRYKLEEKALNDIQSDIDKKTENVGSLDADHKGSKSHSSEVMEELKSVKKNLVEHRKEFGSDDKIKEQYEKKSKDATKAIEIWEPLNKERDMAEEQKSKAAQNLTGKLTEAITKQKEISKIEGKIAELRKDDPEGQLVRLRAEQSNLQKLVNSEQIQADALRLLEKVLESELQKHVEAVGGPIKEKIQTWLQYILQDNSELIVSEEGLPMSIRNPASQEIEFSEQSFGTKEQISVLYRLAIAGLVADQADSGVCLMLDDPFGYTDKGRRERMLEVIESEVKKYGHQVLLFTCRPEDFVGHGIPYPIIGTIEDTSTND